MGALNHHICDSKNSKATCFSSDSASRSSEMPTEGLQQILGELPIDGQKKKNNPSGLCELG